jgi:hypothetical protein
MILITKTYLIFSTDDSDADTPLDNPAIETQTVAKARVRNIKFSGYIQRQWPRPLVRSIETDKVFRIYRTVAKDRVRNIETDKVFRIYAETVA